MIEIANCYLRDSTEYALQGVLHLSETALCWPRARRFLEAAQLALGLYVPYTNLSTGDKTPRDKLNYTTTARTRVMLFAQ